MFRLRRLITKAIIIYDRQTTSKFSPAAPSVGAIPLVLYKGKQRAAGAKNCSLHAFLMAKPFKIINYFCAWDAEIVGIILDVIARRRRKILRKWGWKCDFQRGNCIKIVDFFRRLRRANYRITIKYEQLRSIIPRPALNPPLLRARFSTRGGVNAGISTDVSDSTLIAWKR